MRWRLSGIGVLCVVAAVILSGVAPVAAGVSPQVEGSDSAGEDDEGVPCPPDSATTVSSVGGLQSALAGASPGETVYLSPDASVNIGRNTFDVPNGVTLSGGRGCENAAGALLETTSKKRMPAAFDVHGGRISGIRLAGPFPEMTDASGAIHATARKGIRVTDGVVDNSQVSGWSWAAVNARGNSKVISNEITDTRYTGLGYGVVVDENSNAVIEGNTFARNRHAIAGVGGPTSSYAARGNVFGNGMTSHVVDMHGQGKGGRGGVAGGRIVVEKNTFTSDTHDAVAIRGTPADEATIENNAFAHDDVESAVSQIEGSGGLSVSGNEYALSSSPGESSGVGAAAASLSGDTSIPFASSAGAGADAGAGGGGIFASFNEFSEWFHEIKEALSNPMATFRDTTQGTVELLVERPVPLRNGEPEFILQPTNPPMDTVWLIWFAAALPLALAVAAFYSVIIWMGSGLIPGSMLTPASARNKRLKALTSIIHILASWIIVAVWMHLCRGIARYLTPTGAAMFPEGQSAVEHTVAGGLMGVILWLTGGVLVILAVIVLIIGYFGPLILGPAYPIFTALGLPDFWVFKRFGAAGKWFEGMFVTTTAMVIPTALVLGFGYPVINRFREAGDGPMFEILSIPGLALLEVFMWFVALTLPIIMLMGSRRFRPASMIAGAATGAVAGFSLGRASRSATGAARSASGAAASSASSASTSLTAAGSRVNPVDGSPFQRSTDGGSALAAGSGASSQSALGSASPGSGSGAGGLATPGAVGESNAAGSFSPTSSNGPTGASGGSPSGSPGVTESRPDGIPAGQKYEVGYFNEGSWQPIEDAQFDREWLLDGGYERMSDVYDGRNLHLRGGQSGETFDVREGLSGGPSSSPSPYDSTMTESRGTMTGTKETRN